MNKIQAFLKTRRAASLRDIVKNTYAWPGGHRQHAFMSDGGVICAECCKANYRIIVQATIDGTCAEWGFSSSFVHWEGTPIACDNCGAYFDAEYEEE